MSNYQYNSDNLNRRGFISKESILDLVTQEEIFELATFAAYKKNIEYMNRRESYNTEVELLNS